MILELVCFIGGVLAVVLPGVWLAGAAGLGKDQLERWIYGSVLGLAGAIYLASAVSQVDLRAFYPVWAIVGVGCLIARLRATGVSREWGGI